MELDTMPEVDSPNMIQIKISVPAPLYEQAVELAKRDGWPQATLWRNLWVDGFFAYCERHNKRQVSRKLSDG